MVTSDPLAFTGITAWEFVWGDAATPDTMSLATDAAVTITVSD